MALSIALARHIRSHSDYSARFPESSEARRQNMLKKLMITTALTGAMIGAAAAQSTMDAPAGSAPRANAPMTHSGDAKFINTQSGDQWLSSKFIGLDVVGPDNEKIGDVSDILFEKNGNVVAYVVGVGGFLGIGTKDVALAPSSFQVVPASADRNTTGSAASTSLNDIKLKLNMTKDQLKQAASFEPQRDAARPVTQPAPGTSRPAPR
jgi:hypothetical protein